MSFRSVTSSWNLVDRCGVAPSSGRIQASASSDLPLPYCAAVSIQLMPPARARRIASRFVASSLWMRTPPTAPAPKTISETWMPLRPNFLCFLRSRRLLDTRGRLLHDIPEPVVIGLQLPGEVLGRHIHG